MSIHRNKCTIVALLCLLLTIAQASVQETCTSNLFIESETNVPTGGQCPIAYVNYNNKCNLFSALYKEKRSSTTCNVKSDCVFSSLDCIQQKCTPRFRMIGDACISDSQCLSETTANPNAAQFAGAKCINSKCAYYKYEKSRKIGEACQYDESTKTFYDCMDGGVCSYSFLSSSATCLQKVTAKKGESCLPLDSTKSIVCDNGLYCKTNLLSSTAVCTEKVQYGSPCIKLMVDSNYAPCADGLVCRQNSNSDTSNSCKRIAYYGEYCATNTDCAFTGSGMVQCIDNKCKRVYGTQLGDTCKSDDECYSAYCSSEGKCADPSNLKCSDTVTCPVNSACACGGKAFSSTSAGKCAATCKGANYDVKACIYNLGITPTSEMVGIGTTQYVDEDSSLFTRCRYAFSRYYSCIRKSYVDAGIATKGEMDGISLNAYSVRDSPVLPERNGAQSNVVSMFSFVLLLIVALTC